MQIFRPVMDITEPEHLHSTSREQQIVIASTFTAEPLEPALAFWLETLAIPARIQFAPYNQLFQQLLDPASLFSGNQQGLNILLVRLEDWQASEDSPEAAQEKILRQAQELIDILKPAARRSAVPYLICLCPASPGSIVQQPFSLQQMEAILAAELEQWGGVYVVTSSSLAAAYPVSTYYDPGADKLGHIPYTPAFFTGLATMIARRLYALQSSPAKVIVLDCDQTLWGGVCAEDGVTGIDIGWPWQAVQEFLVAQHQAGMLLCLCSKNDEADVLEVFDHHSEMPLKREHIISWKINWRPKSENIKALAEELQLGLDSFIFMDDNPVECAEVQANCPEVLTFRLPAEAEAIPRFLDQVWAFDHLKVTLEDQQRTRLYQQNTQREAFRRQALTFADFLAGLQLQVRISDAAAWQLARLSQLTQRTNQFNLTTRRRSEGEIQQLWASGGYHCLAVEVKDRFGDYGLVGLIIFELTPDAVLVDTFLLSCRVLGRGIEHQLLAKLGQIALAHGLKQVEALYNPTPRNQPALDFLEKVGAADRLEQAEGYRFTFPAEMIATLSYSPDGIEALEQVNSKAVSQAKIAFSDRESGPSSKSALLNRIATELSDAEQLLNLIESQSRQARPALLGNYVAPTSALEQLLASLWQAALRLEQVGIYDDFFALGGDSIKGAILINEIQKQLQEVVYIVALFDAPTIAELAAYLSEHYPEAVARRLGLEVGRPVPVEINGRVNAARVAQFRQLMPPLPELHQVSSTRNPPAIFILSPPRSGSTLLRVMLAGQPRLFAPPELELLPFNTLAERKAAFAGRSSFFLEGAIRAIKRIKDCPVTVAQQLMQGYEAQQLSTQQFYGLLQHWLKERILVDKSITYALNLETLKRAELYFEKPLYIHLLRHPYGMIHSFEKVRLDQIFFRQDHPFSRRELAELIWLTSHQNILQFLQGVPAERHHTIKFEDLVGQPQKSVEGICQFLKLEFQPEMLQPYAEQDQRMTDGLHAASRMIGDPRFHTHQAIAPEVADGWQRAYSADFLGELTWELAEAMGYKRRQGNNPAEPVRRVEQGRPEQLLAQLEQLSDEEVDALLKGMLEPEEDRAA